MRNESPQIGCIIGPLLCLVLIGLVGVFLVVAFGDLVDSQAAQTRAAAALEYERGRSTALVIQANGQARIDAAQASAILSVAILPWGVLGVLGLLSLVIVSLVGF